ncbi:hypothetical protein NQ318_006459 [Aromia moschata]|uniref:Uncharacterized protein n=1 Tax=Aromia moschata TaxID=1265417 RepID=A0AAV8XTD9_9CUCU|nr:hypothetical protein NQ318_006459 [Aromia moschata]
MVLESLNPNTAELTAVLPELSPKSTLTYSGLWREPRVNLGSYSNDINFELSVSLRKVVENVCRIGKVLRHRRAICFEWHPGPKRVQAELRVTLNID